jgi:CRISPR-associated protein Cas1
MPGIGRPERPPAEPGGTATTDRTHLVVDGFGAFVGKKSERLVLRRDREVVAEVPLHDLERLTFATTAASISIDAIRACVEHGVLIHFLSGGGRPYALLSSPSLSATVEARREQFRALDDERGVALARAFVAGKLRNQANLLKYFAKYRRATDRDAYQRLRQAAERIEAHAAEALAAEAADIEDLRGRLLSVEGRAADLYWQCVGALVAGKADFPGREHRGASDELNAMLNYGYGILYNEAWGALLIAGLEPFAGFLHVDRPGKPSLVLDFVEEFRQAVVDRPILGAVGRGYRPGMEEGRLDEPARREVARLVRERLDARERWEGKQHRLKGIVFLQARRLASFLRDEADYRPFVASW